MTLIALIAALISLYPLISIVLLLLIVGGIGYIRWRFRPEVLIGSESTSGYTGWPDIIDQLPRPYIRGATQRITEYGIPGHDLIATREDGRIIGQEHLGDMQRNLLIDLSRRGSSTEDKSPSDPIDWIEAVSEFGDTDPPYKPVIGELPSSSGIAHGSLAIRN